MAEAAERGGPPPQPEPKQAEPLMSSEVFSRQKPVKEDIEFEEATVNGIPGYRTPDGKFYPKAGGGAGDDEERRRKYEELKREREEMAALDRAKPEQETEWWEKYRRVMGLTEKQRLTREGAAKSLQAIYDAYAARGIDPEAIERDSAVQQLRLQLLGLSPEEIAQVLERRSHLGTYSKVDDLKAADEKDLDPDYTRVRIYVEQVVRVMERDTASPQGADAVKELYGIMNSLFAENEHFRAEMTTVIEGRLNLHIINFIAKFISGAEYTKNITNFYQRHLLSILELAGVEKAAGILEQADLGSEDREDGAYYRKPKDRKYPSDAEFYSPLLKEDLDVDKDLKSGDDKAERGWVIRHKFKLIDEARKVEDGLGLANFKSDSEFRKKDYDELLKIAINHLEQNDKYERQKTGEDIVKEVIEKYGGRLKDSAGAALPFSPEQQERFAKLVDDIARAFHLAESFHHAFGVSVEYDGIRWVDDPDVWKKAPLPERYTQKPPPAIEITGKKQDYKPTREEERGVDWYQEVENFNNNLAGMADDPAFRARNVRGGPVVLNPILEWDDPVTRPKYRKGFKDYPDGELGTGVKVRINLRIAAKMVNEMAGDPDKYGEYGKMVKRVLEDVQSNQAYRVSETWGNELSHVYIQLFPYLSPEASISGRRARELGKVHNKPMDLAKTGEANPGKYAHRMRPLTYFKTLAITTGLGYVSASETVRNWSSSFVKIKAMSKKWAGADELLPLFTKTGPRWLNSASTYEDAENIGKNFSETGEKARQFMAEPNWGEGEMKNFMDNLAEAVMKIRVYDYHKDKEGIGFDYPPDDQDIKKMLNKLRKNGMSEGKYNELERNIIGVPIWWAEFKIFLNKLKPHEGLWDILKNIFKGIFAK
ncbi:hypothetical protein HYW42_01125 [Candidatus Daviesbacteria bacterium]|nr:hypothetical protein [Candidatus Daviesbacteria bacterium]